MELAGKTAIVTGGASGIGRAMAIRFAAAGAHVAVADLDLDGAAAVAGEAASASAGRNGSTARHGASARRFPDLGSAIAFRCDVRDAGQIDALVDEAEAVFGPVDLFCANAGIGGGHGLEADGWDDAYAVNVRAHVQAARRLIPGWLARGEGYFLSTASAAGLLTAIGSGPYTATKHAAVGFAEWLAITYGDRGIKVSCVCPMGVDTPLLARELDLPAPERLGGQAIIAASQLLQPEQVADAVVDGLRAERFLILPHPEVQQRELEKVADREAWLARMRAFQRQILQALEVAPPAEVAVEQHG
jgi:NAD(P)-dependent dehydrogenase (short-subunit alcohol dehydrogenase family)